MPRTDISLSVEEYCVLCRRPLHLTRGVNFDDEEAGNSDNGENENGANATNDKKDSDKANDWESSILAFFNGAVEAEADDEDGHDNDVDNNRQQEQDVRLHITPADPRAPWPGVDYQPEWILKHRVDDTDWLQVTFRARPHPLTNSYEYFDKRENDVQGVLYHVHNCCWQVTRNSFNFQQLFRLAEATRSMFPRTRAFCSSEYKSALTQLRTAPLEKSELSRLLDMPAELRQMVIDQVQDGMAASLLRAQQTASLAERLPSTPPTKGMTKEVVKLQGPGHLVATTSHILGHTYLDKIAFVDEVKEDDGWTETIEVPTTAISTAKIYVGPLGVQAVKLVYEDGTTSSLLGTPSKGNSFIHTLPLHNTSPSLVVSRDDLKSVHIHSPRPATRRTEDDYAKILRYPRAAFSVPESRVQKFPSRALWSVDPPEDSSKVHIVDATYKAGQLRHFSARRLCEYVPLQIGDRSATGLTVYTTISGIVGMTSHFGGDGVLSSSEQFHAGSRDEGAIPQHMRLAKGEYIELAMLIIRQADGGLDFGATPGFAMFVRTNRVQERMFGAYWICYKQDTPTVLLGGTIDTRKQKPKRVTGFFTDALTMADDGTWKSIGVSEVYPEGAVENEQEEDDDDDTRIPPMTRAGFPTATEVRPYPGIEPHLLGLDPVFRLGKDKIVHTSAGIVGAEVATVHLRRSTELKWVLGMCVFYTNGRSVLLGRWMPDIGEEGVVINKIYDVNEPRETDDKDKNLTGLSFKMSEDRHHLEDILLNIPSPSIPVDLYIYLGPDQDQHIEWWCGYTEDKVRVCNNGYQYLTFREDNGEDDLRFPKKDLHLDEWKKNARV